VRRLWSVFQQKHDLISVGAYEAGSSAEIDLAIALRPQLEAFLRQDMHEGVDYERARDGIRELIGA
jgi:flagellum-specific ATP synthase